MYHTIFADTLNTTLYFKDENRVLKLGEKLIFSAFNEPILRRNIGRWNIILALGGDYEVQFAYHDRASH